MLANLPQLLAYAANNIGATTLLNPSLFDKNLLAQSEAAQIAKFQLLQNILQVLSTTSTTSIPQNIDPLYTMQLSEYLKLNPQLHLQSLEEFAISTSNIPPLSTHAFISPNVDLDHGLGSKAFSEHVSVPMGDVNTDDQLGIIKQSGHLSSSNPTSSSTTHDANWQDFMDDEASGCYWKEIVE
ncbi:hypothetical protein M8C21_002256 [Ambrosia artemisiifolia]|uniref:Uncharacterized protein n=1 Tax=Ambrosia artemisiifolia TaxID=4212 RepID=A0AAD5BNV6_AMBAR|nr:hypothetical protein M8C21_002256 [Ambrosia artemisiifolia]